MMQALFRLRKTPDHSVLGNDTVCFTEYESVDKTRQNLKDGIAMITYHIKKLKKYFLLQATVLLTIRFYFSVL